MPENRIETGKRLTAPVQPETKLTNPREEQYSLSQ